MKIFATATFLCFITPAMTAFAGENLMLNTWFSDRDYATIEIKLYDDTVDGHTPIKTAIVNDPDAVKKIVDRIEHLPADGPKFKSLAPKETIELAFESTRSRQVIKIYDGHFKTPSTGFNTTTEAERQEALIYKDMLALLNTKMNQALLKIKGHEYAFSEFTIIYDGMKPYDYAPITVSGQKDLFTIKSKEGEYKAVISSGQLPAQPHRFTINQKSFFLQTYRTNNGTSLPPDTFLVEEVP